MSHQKSWVVRLVAVNALIFILPIFNVFDNTWIIEYFSLIPSEVLYSYRFWQVFSYMFIHGSAMHIIINMFILINFGMLIEQIWGPVKFIKYYLFCGVGAGLFIVIISFFTGSAFSSPTIGASGAIFGLLLAFSIFFPDTEILVFFILPVKAKYFIVIYGGIELMMEITGGQPQVSHLGHLGGIVFGLIYFALFEKMRRPKAARVFEKKIAKLEKRKEQKKGESENKSNQDMKKNILLKLRNTPSKEILTDDEYQYIKYLDILIDTDIKETKKSEMITDESFINEVRSILNL